MVDMQCPKCGSDYTQRVKLQVFDGTVKELWWLIVIFTVFGFIINPIILLFAFVVMVLTIITNILAKQRNRNNWVIKCTRCGHQFTIINPDKVETLNAQRESKQKKQEEIIKHYAEKNRKVGDALKQNGKLEIEEKLLNTVDYFSPHKLFYTASSQLKITNKALVCFNAKSSLRLPKKNITYIKKKNYFLIIPTGIQICVMKNGKKKKYNFVVYAGKTRNEILKMLNKWKQS